MTEYEKFVNKFKPKLTTDDCYTPPPIYEAIKNWAIKEYKLQDKQILRPFYPGGDYQKEKYTDTTVVIDNPPFSIHSEIIVFYLANDIPFFIFSPLLTSFSSFSKGRIEKITIIVINNTIEYENGAKVKTGFTTNMDNCIVRTAPNLNKAIKEAQKSISPQKPRLKNQYPQNVINFSKISTISDQDIKIYNAHFIRGLDSQKEHKKEIYGCGLLVSNKDAQEIINLQNAKKKKKKEKNIDYIWELSEREQKIIKTLGGE